LTSGAELAAGVLLLALIFLARGRGGAKTRGEGRIGDEMKGIFGPGVKVEYRGWPKGDA
jgi:hypothetical protein